MSHWTRGFCLLILIVLNGTLGACRGSQLWVTTRSPEELYSLDKESLLTTFGEREHWSTDVKQKLRDEVRRRKIFEDGEWALVDARKVKIGSREEVLWASWGSPQKRISEHVSTHGTTKVLDYGDQWVTVENGRVDSISSYGR